MLKNVKRQKKMIRIEVRDKVLDFDEKDIKVLKVDKNGNAKRLDIEEEKVDWSDVRAAYRARRGGPRNG